MSQRDPYESTGMVRVTRCWSKGKYSGPWRKLPPPPQYLCHDCRLDVSQNGEYMYMLRDEVWQAHCPPGRHVLLCAWCLQLRVGRPLHRDDFDWSRLINRAACPRSALLRSFMIRTKPAHQTAG